MTTINTDEYNQIKAEISELKIHKANLTAQVNSLSAELKSNQHEQYYLTLDAKARVAKDVGDRILAAAQKEFDMVVRNQHFNDTIDDIIVDNPSTSHANINNSGTKNIPPNNEANDITKTSLHVPVNDQHKK